MDCRSFLPPHALFTPGMVVPHAMSIPFMAHHSPPKPSVSTHRFQYLLYPLFRSTNLSILISLAFAMNQSPQGPQGLQGGFWQPIPLYPSTNPFRSVKRFLRAWAGEPHIYYGGSTNLWVHPSGGHVMVRKGRCPPGYIYHGIEGYATNIDTTGQHVNLFRIWPQGSYTHGTPSIVVGINLRDGSSVHASFAMETWVPPALYWLFDSLLEEMQFQVKNSNDPRQDVTGVKWVLGDGQDWDRPTAETRIDGAWVASVSSLQ